MKTFNFNVNFFRLTCADIDGAPIVADPIGAPAGTPLKTPEEVEGDDRLRVNIADPLTMLRRGKQRRIKKTNIKYILYRQEEKQLPIERKISPNY